MAEGIKLGSGWCEIKQADCSARERCETDRINTLVKINSAEPPTGFLNKLLHTLGQSSGYALPAARAEVDVELEKERLTRFDLLLARNCGAVCIIDDALETTEFRDLRSDEPLIESSTIQTNTLGYITEEIK